MIFGEGFRAVCSEHSNPGHSNLAGPMLPR